MAITAGWYDETQRVILQRYQGRWTWEELSIAAGTARALTASVPHSVVLFIDMLTLTKSLKAMYYHKGVPYLT